MTDLLYLGHIHEILDGARRDSFEEYIIDCDDERPSHEHQRINKSTLIPLERVSGRVKP